MRLLKFYLQHWYIPLLLLALFWAKSSFAEYSDRNSVVMIIAEQWQGSGFVIGSSGKDSYVVTNKHVCTNSEKKRPIKWYYIEWTLSDHPAVLGELVKTDKNHDLCLIRFTGTSPKAKISDKSGYLGQKVYTIGNPGSRPAISYGYINEFNIEFMGEYMVGFNAPIFPGASGSPVYNYRQEVIGVVAATGLEDRTKSLYVQLYYLRVFLKDYLKYN